MNKLNLLGLTILLAVGALGARGQSSVNENTYSKKTVIIVDSIFVTRTVVDTVYLPAGSPSADGLSSGLGSNTNRSGARVPMFGEEAQRPLHSSDTLHITPAMLAERRNTPRVEKFERDIESTVFVPRGQWIAGVSFNYSQSNQKNYQFFVFEDIDADTYTFKVTPMLAYAFRNDIAAGLKFSYTRSLAKLANTDLVIDSETDMNIDHIYSLSHNYYATALLRNYFSLGTSKRFGFFNEVQLELGGGQSKLTKGVGNSLTGTYETNFSLDIGLVPGLIMFLSNWSALEVNVGVLGFSYRNTWSETDRIYHARRHSSSANFRINLLSITFGTTFYL